MTARPPGCTCPVVPLPGSETPCSCAICHCSVCAVRSSYCDTGWLCLTCRHQYENAETPEATPVIELPQPVDGQVYPALQALRALAAGERRATLPMRVRFDASEVSLLTDELWRLTREQSTSTALERSVRLLAEVLDVDITVTEYPPRRRERDPNGPRAWQGYAERRSVYDDPSPGDLVACVHCGVDTPTTGVDHFWFDRTDLWPHHASGLDLRPVILREVDHDESDYVGWLWTPEQARVHGATPNFHHRNLPYGGVRWPLGDWWAEDHGYGWGVSLTVEEGTL